MCFHKCFFEFLTISSILSLFLIVPGNGFAESAGCAEQSTTIDQKVTVQQNEMQSLLEKEQKLLKSLTEEAESNVKVLKEEMAKATSEEERRKTGVEINKVYQEMSKRAFDIRIATARETGNTLLVNKLEVEKARYMDSIQPKPASPHLDMK